MGQHVDGEWISVLLYFVKGWKLIRCLMLMRLNLVEGRHDDKGGALRIFEAVSLGKKNGFQLPPSLGALSRSMKNSSRVKREKVE